jgi:hypothetical protein
MTMSLVRLLVLAAAVVLLVPACANFRAVEPGTSADQMRARMGAPADVWKNADGTETWEYRYGPAGWYTYMVDLGPDRAVRAVRQVLSEEYLSRVRPGMSREEVHRLLGAPKEIAHYPRSNEEVWSWRFKEQNTWYRLFLVSFDQSTGSVLRTYRIDDPMYYDKGGRGRG